MNLRRNLWDDERICYHSAIYKRSTLRAMIREHNAGTCPLDAHGITYCTQVILDESRFARSILYHARARALGYSS